MTKYPEWNKYQAERKHKIKLMIITHYSNSTMKCDCCDEKVIDFLTLEHINGGGNKERKKYAKGNNIVTFYNWLIKNKYPKGYRILCFNCNIGKQVNGGMCPHEDKEYFNKTCSIPQY